MHFLKLLKHSFSLGFILERKRTYVDEFVSQSFWVFDIRRRGDADDFVLEGVGELESEHVFTTEEEGGAELVRDDGGVFEEFEFHPEDYWEGARQ